MKVSILKVQTYLLYSFFFSVNFEVWDPLSTGGYFSLSKLFGIFYFLTIIPNIGTYLTINKNMYTVLIPIFIFYLILMLNNFYNIGVYSNDFLSLSILLNIIFFILIVNHERHNLGSIEKGFLFFLLGAILTSILFIFEIGTEYTIDGRVSLFGDDENAIGLRMVVASMMIVHFLLKYKEKKIFTIFLIFSLFPIVNLLFNTGSRLSVINLLLCSTFYIFLYKTKNIINKFLVIFIFLSFIGYVIDLILSSEVVGKRLKSTIDDGNLAGRDDIWKSVLPLIEDNLIIGVGQTGYIDYMYKISGQYKSPHNVILEVLALTGILGLFFYLSFIFFSFLNSFKFYLRSNEVIPLIFAIPIAGLLLSGQLLVVKLGWFILAYAATRKYHSS